MKQFFIRLWSDESFFSRCIRVLMLGGGKLISDGTIPTGINGAGGKIGIALMALSVFIPAGQLNDQKP